MEMWVPVLWMSRIPYVFTLLSDINWLMRRWTSLPSPPATLSIMCFHWWGLGCTNVFYGIWWDIGAVGLEILNCWGLLLWLVNLGFLPPSIFSILRSQGLAEPNRKISCQNYLHLCLHALNCSTYFHWLPIFSSLFNVVPKQYNSVRWVVHEMVTVMYWCSPFLMGRSSISIWYPSHFMDSIITLLLHKHIIVDSEHPCPDPWNAASTEDLSLSSDSQCTIYNVYSIAWKLGFLLSW